MPGDRTRSGHDHALRRTGYFIDADHLLILDNRHKEAVEEIERDHHADAGDHQHDPHHPEERRIDPPLLGQTTEDAEDLLVVRRAMDSERIDEEALAEIAAAPEVIQADHKAEDKREDDEAFREEARDPRDRQG